MRIDEVKDHIGEEWRTNRGSWSAKLSGDDRVRIEKVVTVETTKGQSWRRVEPTTTRKRWVKVTLLDITTGEPMSAQPRRVSSTEEPTTEFLIEAKQLEEPWEDYWERTKTQREQTARRHDIQQRLRPYLPDSPFVGWGGGLSITLTLDAAEALADLLDRHVPGVDEEG